MRVFKSSYKDRAGVKRQTSKFYVEFRDHLQRVRRLPAFSGKKESEALGRQIEKLVACKVSGEQPDVQLARWLESIPAKMREHFVRIGLMDSSRAAAGKLLVEHITDFEQSLMDKGNTRKQARMTVSRVRRIAKEGRFATWTDIAASKVQRCIAGMQENGLSKKTSNYYLKAFQHFTRWMVEDGRATASPVAHLRALEIQKQDIRRPRRPLEVDEIRRLLEATRAAEPYLGMTGYERALLYRLACESGLRANELRTLTVGSFDFDHGTVTVQDRDAKNRHEATLPIRPDTAVELKTLFANMLPAKQAFKVPDKPANMLKPDLAAAGIPYQDEAGRYCDFHSLRHTMGTLLAQAGVHPKTAQDIMRHSKIDLTMNLYTCTKLEGRAKAIESLPDLSAPSSQSQKNVKTGTDDVTTPGVLASRLALRGARQCPTMPSLEIANPAHAIASGVFSEADGDRTHNLRIDSPMLENPKSLPNTPLTENPESDLASCLALLPQKYPDLAALVKAWPDLPEQTKAAIIAQAKSALKEGRAQ